MTRNCTARTLHNVLAWWWN